MAKILNKRIIESISKDLYSKLEELLPEHNLSDYPEIYSFIIDHLNGFIDDHFWFDEGVNVLVMIIDHIENTYCFDLESTIYEGKSSKLIKFFETLISPYTVH